MGFLAAKGSTPVSHSRGMDGSLCDEPRWSLVELRLSLFQLMAVKECHGSCLQLGVGQSPPYILL